MSRLNPVYGFFRLRYKTKVAKESKNIILKHVTTANFLYSFTLLPHINIQLFLIGSDSIVLTYVLKVRLKSVKFSGKKFVYIKSENRPKANAVPKTKWPSLGLSNAAHDWSCTCTIHV